MLGMTNFVELSALHTVTFLVNYFIHSSVFILAIMACFKLGWLKADVRGETVLKTTLVIGVISSTIALFRPDTGGLSWQLVTQPPVALNNASTWTPEERLANSMPDSPDFVTLVSVPKEAAMTQYEDGTALAPLGNQTYLAKDDNSKLTNTFDFGDLSMLSLWIVLYWACGIVLMGAIRFYQHLQLKLMMSNRVLLQDVMVMSGLASLKKQAGYNGEIKLFASPSITSPIVLNQKEIVLPEVFVKRYSSAQQQAALAHELAHLKRNDVLWKNMFLMFDVLFFFQPLNRLLRKNLNQVVEQRADEVASAWTGNPRALAEALSVTVEQHLGSRHSRWVLAMKCEKSDLVVRVENLLKGGVEKTKNSVMSLLFMMTIVVTMLAPGLSLNVSAQTAGKSQESGQEIIISEGNSSSWSHSENIEEDGPIKMTISSSTDDTHWKLSTDMRGLPQFDDSETQITYFPPDSEMEVSVDDGKDKRKLTISRDNGDIEYIYYVNRQRTDIADDPQWFSSFIPELLRKTGWHAQKRMSRFLEEGGVNAVLDEVRLMTHDRAKELYLSQLPLMYKLTPEDIDQVIIISGSIHSDYAKANSLLSLLQNTMFEERNYRHLIANIGDLESDFEMAKVLRSAVMSAPLDSDIWHDLVMSAEQIQSDHELAKLLSELVRHRPIRDNALNALYKVSGNIQSDYELSTLLSVVAEKLPLNSDTVLGLLYASRAIESDYEMRKTLSMLITNILDDNGVLRLIDVAKDNIQSDYELANLFLDLIRSRELSPRLKDEVFDALDAIQGDNDRLRVLRELKA